MKLSQKGIDFLIELEDLRLQPYNDQTGRTIKRYCEGATIGIGHLIKKVYWNDYKDGITEKKAIELLQSDLKEFEYCVNNNLLKKANQDQFDAMVIFAFNIGSGAFLKSSMLKIFNTGYYTLESAWKAYNKSQGKVMNGLINRRNKEWELFKSGYNLNENSDFKPSDKTLEKISIKPLKKENNMSILAKFIKTINVLYPIIVGVVNIWRSGKDMPKATDIK
jgi:GH24 family phage-related lysozyme (muramidase)